MTITYSAEVATCRGLGNFYRLLARWRGSIYKLVWPDMILYLVCYFALSLFYRLYLKKRNDQTHKNFRNFVHYCDNYNKYIPLSFILGFYVSIVVSRWWNQFMLLPWPDNLATLISTNIHGHDERGRMMRRTMMRYLNLSFVIAMSMMSTPAKRRFPTFDHMVEAGFLLPHEQVIIDHLNAKTRHPKYWVPIVWTGSILSSYSGSAHYLIFDCWSSRARRENRIPDDMSMNEIIIHLTKWRGGLGDLLGYDWATIPLMYTQVVTLAVYMYFFAALIGKQFIEDKARRIDLYFPIFTMIEFFFYVGWLKVAETLVNPFGEDDDDFEINWLIDRNLQVSYLIVDEMHSVYPPMLKDQFWDEVGQVQLPYTEAAVKYKTDGHQGSANYVFVDEDKAQFVTNNDDKDLNVVMINNQSLRSVGSALNASDMRVGGGSIADTRRKQRKDEKDAH